MEELLLQTGKEEVDVSSMWPWLAKVKAVCWTG